MTRRALRESDGTGKISKNASAGRACFLLPAASVASRMATASRPDPFAHLISAVAATSASPAAVEATAALPARQPKAPAAPVLEPRDERAPAPRWVGAPRWAVLLTALLATTVLFPQPLLRDAETLRPMDGTWLVESASYVVLAPLTTSFDQLSLLSVRQHISVIACVLLLYAWWAVWRSRRAVRTSAVVAFGAVLTLLAGIVAVYFVVCLVPRPMLSLGVRDADLVRVDFHAHTGASHDGRKSFDAERSREWHRLGGFDVAYVSDHGTYVGVEPGVRRNPARAGDGVVLLSAVEAWSGGEHLNILGATAADSAFLRHDQQIVDAEVERAIAAGRRTPVFIETVPGWLDTLVVGIAGGFPGRAIARVTAIELSDAAPRGFDQTDSTYERVLHLADSLDLAVVAGSDNHGWGRTAAAWSLVPIPGWRALSPDSLGHRIETHLLTHRRSAVRVVERGRPRTIAGPAMLLNAPIVVWHLFATLTPASRLSWLLWTWGLAYAWCVLRRRAAREDGSHDDEPFTVYR